jgi:hypothetical protein
MIIYSLKLLKLLTQSIQITKKITYLTGFSSGGPNMNNSTRNLKMKKLLIASTALVATAGMASADITISGHAAAGIYSGLGNADGVAANVAGTASKDYTAIRFRWYC